MKCDNIKAAEAALEKRAGLFAARNSILNDANLNVAEKAGRIGPIDADIDRLGEEAENHVRAAEKEAEHRALNERAALAVAKGGRQAREAEQRGQWDGRLIPNATEYRTLMVEGTPGDGGYAVPDEIAQRWIDRLRAQSVVLRAPGINVVRFTGGSFTLPQLTATGNNVKVYGEGAQITRSTASFAPILLEPRKFAAYYEASAELVADSAIDIDSMTADVMVRDIASKVDGELLDGEGGTTELVGLSTAGNSTRTYLGAATDVTWSNVLTAYGQILATGATPTAILASIDQWEALVGARENGSTGAFMSGSVRDDITKAAFGLPLIPSANVPAGTLFVADFSRVFIGVRSDIRIARSVDFKFDTDVIAYRATYRIAGVKAAEATSVRMLLAEADPE